MKESDLVATMRIFYTSEGEGAVVAGANTVATAQDKVAASANALAAATESSARRQTSAAAAFQQMANRMDPANRAMADLQRNIDVYSKALANNSSITDAAGNGLDVYLAKINAQRTAVEALIRQQEILASQQRAAASTPVLPQDAINKSLGIDQVAPPSSAKTSASTFFSQADIQAQVKATDDLTAAVSRMRAAMNPLEAEQGKLGAQSALANAALKSGAITAEDYAVEQERIAKVLAATTAQFNPATSAQLGMTAAMTELRAAMNPLEAEQGRLGAQSAIFNSALKSGTMTAEEYAVAQQKLSTTFAATAAQLDPAAAAQAAMAASATKLIASLDPLAMTQQRLIEQGTGYKAMLEAGLLTEDQYTAAVQKNTVALAANEAARREQSNATTNPSAVTGNVNGTPVSLNQITGSQLSKVDTSAYAAQFEGAAKAQDAMAASAKALIASLDPLGAEQQRLIDQGASYKAMLEAGMLTQDQYTAAIQKNTAALTANEALRREQSNITTDTTAAGTANPTQITGQQLSNVNTQAYAGQFEAAAKAQDGQTAAIQRLRAAMNPLEVEQSKLGAQSAIYNAALKSGAMTAAEYAAAQGMLGSKLKEFEGAAKAAGEGATGFGLAAAFGSTQSMALTAAVRHMFDAWMAGIPITRVVASELGNVSYGLSGSGGLMGSLSKLGEFLGAEGIIAIGLTAIGAAFLAFDYATSKAAQAVQSVKSRLESLGGIKLGDEYSKSLEGLTKDLGITRDQAQPTYEAMLKLVSLRGPPNGVQILGPGLPEYLDRTKINAESLTSTFKAVYEQLRLGDSDLKSAAAGASAFLTDIITKGNLTGDALRKLQDSGVGGARAAQTIASAMTNGQQNAEQYAAALDKIPAPLIKIITNLKQVEAGSAPAFKDLIENPKTVSVAIEQLDRSFGKLWDSITGADQPKQGAAQIGLVTQAISGLARAIEENAPAIKQQIDQEVNDFTAISNAVKKFNDDGSEQLRSFNEAVIQYLNIREGGALLKGGLDSANTDINHFAQSANAAFASFASAAVSAAQSAASAIASIIKGSAQSANVGGGAPPSVGSTDAVGGIGIGSGNSNVLTSSGDAGTVNLDNVDPSMVTNAGNFATGGSFTVGGTGGTDSQLIQFMATPGEKVKIDTPGSSSSDTPSSAATSGSAADAASTQTLGALVPSNDTPPNASSGSAPKTLDSLIPSNDNTPTKQSDVLSAHISEYLKTQTAAINDKLGTAQDAITASINNLGVTFKTVMASSTIATSSGTTSTTPATTTSSAASPSTASTASTASGTSSSGGGGGGFSTQKSSDDQSNKAVKAALDAANKAAGPAIDYGIAAGLGTSVRGASAGRSSNGPGNAITKPGSGADSYGLIYAPYSGQMDEFGKPPAGMPGSPYYGPQAPNGTFVSTGTTGFPGGLAGLDARSGGVSDTTDFASRFDALGDKTTGATKQQTDALKQAYLEANKTVADTVKDQTNDTKTIGDQTNQSLNNVDKAAQDTASTNNDINQATIAGNQATESGFQSTNDSLGAVGTGVGETTQAVSSGSSSIVDSIGSLGSSMMNAVSSVMKGGGPGMSGLGGGGGVASGQVSQGGVSANDFASGYGDQSQVTATGSSIQGASAGNVDNSSGFTPSAQYFEQGLQGYATGGQFKVKGAVGATDTEHVQFMASPGEVVTITPPGGTPPPDPAKGGAPSNKAGMMAFATGGQFTLGQLDGTPTVPKESADLISANISQYLTTQTANLKDKLDDVASKIVAAVNNGSVSITSTITSALAQMAADAKTAAGGASNNNVTTGAPAAGIAGTTGAAQSNSDAGLQAYLYYYRLQHSQLQYHGIGAGEQSQQIFNPAGLDTSVISPSGGWIAGGTGMAEGGTFVVPGGSGQGNDSVNVAIKASPGERIMVLPPDEAKALDGLKNVRRFTPEPLDKFMPALQDNVPGKTSDYSVSGDATTAHQAPSAPGMSRGSGDSPGMQHGAPVQNKYVTINVQQGVQADDFIRSRAEVQRAASR